jgi:hypothetical protein
MRVQIQGHLNLDYLNSHKDKLDYFGRPGGFWASDLPVICFAKFFGLKGTCYQAFTTPCAACRLDW